MTIKIANYGSSSYSGWFRRTVDRLPPHPAGSVGETRYVVGRSVGLDTHIVDLRITLQPGEVREVDLARAVPWPFVRGEVPGNPISYFGGPPSIGGSHLDLVSIVPDGAAYLTHWRARTGRLFAIDLWAAWYPGQPAIASGEVTVTASNPAVPDMTVTVPPDFTMRFGDAMVLVPGAAPNAPLLPAGTTFADGQSRSFPVTLVWPRHLRTAEDWASAGALANLAISGNGIEKLWPDGNPVPVPGLDRLAWTRSHWSDCISSLHRWQRPSGLGVNERSKDTGAQQDQVFVGAEGLGPTGLGAETVYYLTALAQSRRPCHHLEADGSPLDLAKHPSLRLWEGRPHRSGGDMLGKPRELGETETHGWWGGDVEHFLINTLSIAARLTGSPALQWQLEHEAKVYLLQLANSPYLFAARAHGWEGIAVVHFWWNLENRALAEAVRAAWLAHFDAVLKPQLSVKPGDLWDVRVDDPRLGTGEWTIPWQAAVGAYGIDLAGRTFNRPDACALALRGAKATMATGWVKQPDGTWLTYFNRAVDGRGTPTHDANNFGLPMAPAVVLRYEPNNQMAREIWASIASGGGQWIDPGIMIQ